MRPLTTFLIIFVFCLFFSNKCRAEGPAPIAIESTIQKLRLMVGESTIIPINEKYPPVKTVEMVEPKTADAIVLTPRQIYISGKAIGITTLVLRDENNIAFAVYDVQVYQVYPDIISRLKEKLHELLPDEKIEVQAAHDSIVLSGVVSSAANMSTALSVAEQFVPKKEKLVNLMQVGGVQQVMLEVRVAEMSSALTRRLGFNFAYVSGADFALSLLGNLTTVESIPAEGPFDILLSSRINALFRFGSDRTTWTAFIDALKEHELVKVLAQPTLIATSGQKAEFLAGGEIPIPVPEEYGRVTIEWKKYGVLLSFTPTVLSSEKISMRVAPYVSEPDYTRSVYYAGWAIPAFTTRGAETTIELADGQSFAIAGLLKEDVRQTVSKFPILGNIPVLGALFRSSEFQRHESELVIIVTPHLVKPLDMTKQTLPTDQYIEPDDFEFYLLGSLEGRKERTKVGLEGEFGYIMP